MSFLGEKFFKFRNSFKNLEKTTLKTEKKIRQAISLALLKRQLFFKLRAFIILQSCSNLKISSLIRKKSIKKSLYTSLAPRQKETNGQKFLHLDAIK